MDEVGVAAARSASAIAVSVGLAWLDVGVTDALATYSPATP